MPGTFLKVEVNWQQVCPEPPPREGDDRTGAEGHLVGASHLSVRMGPTFLVVAMRTGGLVVRQEYRLIVSPFDP